FRAGAVIAAILTGPPGGARTLSRPTRPGCRIRFWTRWPSSPVHGNDGDTFDARIRCQTRRQRAKGTAEVCARSPSRAGTPASAAGRYTPATRPWSRRPSVWSLSLVRCRPPACLAPSGTLGDRPGRDPGQVGGDVAPAEGGGRGAEDQPARAGPADR